MFGLFFPAKKVIMDNRSWLIMSTVIFLASAFIFYFTTAATPAVGEQVMENQFNQLDNLFSMILGTTPVISALLVFMNNFLSMAQMLLLGFLAGISPLFTLGINGSLVGMLLSITSEQGMPLLSMVLFGLLPHGIPELFAFFLCGALGLKFGYHCVASPLPGKTRLQSYRYIWKEAISVLPLVVVLLFTAALIEIFITPNLLEMFL